MKKIVMGIAAAALATSMFAGEPASNPSVASFNGNASVEWGVDLDAGKTGFKNDTWTEFKMVLFDSGNKATSGEGVWGELKIKSDADYDKAWFVKDAGETMRKAVVDVAKLHFNNFYVGIMSGDTQTGKVNFTTAVRSRGDGGAGTWLSDVGPANYTQGIVGGFENNNLNVAVDFRSLADSKTQYTDAYAVAAEATLKDGNEWVNGLEVKLGGSYDVSTKKYTKNDSFAAEGTDITQLVMTKDEWKALGHEEAKEDIKVKGHILGYSASAAYKYNLDDKYYVKPMVGLTGTTLSVSDSDKKVKGTRTETSLVASVIYGWGATDGYVNPGLFYFNDNTTNGATPGISLVANIPMVKVAEVESNGTKNAVTTHDKLIALLIPSFYSGTIDAIPELKAIAYSEIGIYNGETKTEKSGNTATVKNGAKDKDNTLAFAVAAALQYDIKADAITVTPKAGMRFANATYVDNDTGAYTKGSDKLFETKGLGIQEKKTEAGKTDLYDGDFFNLSLGVNVAGLVSNTDFYCNYVSANLMNSTKYDAKDANGDTIKYYNVKTGTLNVGCKIHF